MDGLTWAGLGWSRGLKKTQSMDPSNLHRATRMTHQGSLRYSQVRSIGKRVLGVLHGIGQGKHQQLVQALVDDYRLLHNTYAWRKGCPVELGWRLAPCAITDDH